MKTLTKSYRKPFAIAAIAPIARYRRVRAIASPVCDCTSKSYRKRVAIGLLTRSDRTQLQYDQCFTTFRAIAQNPRAPSPPYGGREGARFRPRLWAGVAGPTGPIVRWLDTRRMT